MPRSDYLRRTKPRVEVLRGWDPNEPTTFTQTFRVKSAVTILSGQVISEAWNATDSVYEWELGGAAGRVPSIAVQDGADEDVSEANGLTGLSCNGRFEIETAFLKAAQTWGVNKPVTYDGVTGNIKVAVAGEDIMGWATRNHTTKSLNGINSGVPTDTVVVSFYTAWQAVAALPV